MSRIRGKDTKPELAVRMALHRAGYRYRLHVRRLPGTPDLVFPSRKMVIFVNGCFWHSHDCKNGRATPSTNSEFWREKRGKTVVRDLQKINELAELGWKCLTVWECQLVAGGDGIDSAISFLESA